MAFWDTITEKMGDIKDFVVDFVMAVNWWALFWDILAVVLHHQKLIDKQESSGAEAREQIVADLVGKKESEMGGIGDIADEISKYESDVRKLLEVAVRMMWRFGPAQVGEILEGLKYEFDMNQKIEWKMGPDYMELYKSKPDK